MTVIDPEYFALREGAWNYQIKDSLLLNGKKYDIERILPNISHWFLPDFNSFEPFYRIPACWRGYQCDYVIKNRLLYLVNFNINDKNNNYPKFLGKTPDLITPAKYFKASYKDIFYNFEFTGTLILVRNLLNDKLSYKKRAKLWMFEEVIKLHFRNGRLTKKIDNSKKMEGIRNFKEAKIDILRIKIGQQILHLCCQWIEANKNKFHCEFSNEDERNIINSYLAYKKLLTILESSLLRQSHYIFGDDLLLEIINLCNEWIVSNIDYCKKRSITRRVLTYEQKFKFLAHHLISPHRCFGKNIATYLKEKYPKPTTLPDTNTIKNTDIDTITNTDTPKLHKGFFSRKRSN